MVGVWWSKLFQRYIVSKITLGHGWPILQAGHDELTQRDTFLQHKTKSRLAANDSLKSMDWSKVSLFTNTKLCLDWRAIIFKRSFRSLVTYVTNRPGWIDPKRPVCDKTFLRYQFFLYRIWYFFFQCQICSIPNPILFCYQTFMVPNISNTESFTFYINFFQNWIRYFFWYQFFWYWIQYFFDTKLFDTESDTIQKMDFFEIKKFWTEMSHSGRDPFLTTKNQV